MSLILRGLRNKRTSYSQDTLLTRIILQFRVYESPYQEYRAGFEVSTEKLYSRKSLTEAVAAQDWDFLDHVLLVNPDLDISALEGLHPLNNCNCYLRLWQEYQKQFFREGQRRSRNYSLISVVCFGMGILSGPRSWLTMGFVALVSIAAEKLLYQSEIYDRSYAEVRARFKC